MKKNKTLILLGSICLVLVLAVLPFVGACAAPPPPEEFKIDILTSKTGGAGYVMSFALADIINKTHPWLQLRGIETTGIAENVKTMAAEAERRPNTVIFANAGAVHQSKVADPPYDVPYDTLRAIALFNPARLFWVTLDSNLKTPRDLVGKKVGLFPSGSPSNIQWQAMAQYGFGVDPEDIDWVYTPLGPGMDSLADGRMDATWALASPAPLNTPVFPLEKLMAVRDVYFVGFSEDGAKASRENTGYPTYVARVPAGTYTPGQLELFAHIQLLSWWADVEMDDDIVYEITKAIYENVDKFADYHALGKTMTQTSIAEIGAEKTFHPGAVKFYKEKGIKIGLE